MSGRALQEESNASTTQLWDPRARAWSQELIAEFGLRFCFNFLFVAGLSFLGLGIQPPLADWGGMVRDNAAAISYGGLAPLIPAAAIGVFAIAINLVVDWSLARQAGQRD